MKRVAAFSRVHVEVFPDSTGSSFKVYALLTECGLLPSLLDYVVEMRTRRGLSWQYKLVHDVRLFLEYLTAQEQHSSGQQAFIQFSQRLLTGTFSSSSGMDPSGLCWTPRPIEERNRIVGRLTAFFDWLHPSNSPNHPNPGIDDAYGKLLDSAAFEHRKASAFLGHTWRNSYSASHARRVAQVRGGAADAAEVKAFPESKFNDLIEDGFRVGSRISHRDIAITLLLHGGGLRVSEPFHLFPTDVFPNPDNPDLALVFVRHPSFGRAPTTNSNLSRGTTRREYLSTVWGLVPRNELTGQKFAGWKEGKHERSPDGDIYLRVYWAPEELGVKFFYHWRMYLEQIIDAPRRHPFALVNLSSPIGSEYCIGKYEKAHAAAVRRIGLIPSKFLGTSPHGHRHAYGQRLRRAGVHQTVIQVAMHHMRMESQGIYTGPSHKETQDAVFVALSKLGKPLNCGDNSK